MKEEIKIEAFVQYFIEEDAVKAKTMAALIQRKIAEPKYCLKIQEIIQEAFNEVSENFYNLEPLKVPNNPEHPLDWFERADN